MSALRERVSIILYTRSTTSVVDLKSPLLRSNVIVCATWVGVTDELDIDRTEGCKTKSRRRLVL